MIVREATSSLVRKLASRLFIFKMSERFVDAGLVDNFIAEQENKATLQKAQRDVKLLQTFLGTKNELRKVEEIPALEVNEYMCEFIISVRTKDGKDYEPACRSLLASFERHLKKNSYSASIMIDLVFEKTRKVLLSKQKELEKKGKGNKPNASIPLTSDELNTLYEKGLLGTRNPEALLNTLWLNKRNSCILGSEAAKNMETCAGAM